MRELRSLHSIYAANRQLIERFGPLVRIPPGDDMAGLRLRRGELLVAVDQVIAGRHFRAGTPWHLVGRKAVCRNLSDVAAMAGTPLACVASAALPPGLPQQAVAELYEGLRSTAETYGCPLVGGDTGALPSDDDALVVAVTILADWPTDLPGPITRCGALAGDGIYVTGRLGGSLGADGLGRHLTFEPRLEESVSLARMLGERLHAMIDVSDGLGMDARHLAEASEVEVILDVERLPCAPGCTWAEALGDGEDYELCFAAAGPVPSEVRGLPITRVGEARPMAEAEPGAGTLVVRLGGCPIEPPSLGWEHGGTLGELAR